MKGLVIKNTGSWYTVLTDSGETVNCKVKGNFRLKGIRSTNPVAVGDRVSLSSYPSPVGRGISPTSNFSPVERAVAFITGIEDRRNYIIRKSSNLSKQSHIIAANVDQALLIVTVNYPETSTTFIDRFLASAEAYRVPVVLVFNKYDLLSPDDLQLQEQMMLLYQTVGYQCVAVSAETGYGLDDLRALLDGKITLLSGNSGVGKSTLINRLVPGVQLRTAEISDAHNTGMHTTTFSEMIPLPNSSTVQQFNSSTVQQFNSSYLIDTPGIKGFGTFDMEPEELTSYFRELFHYSSGCRFSNCTHTHEPGCAVLKALDEGLIAPSRYESYLSMMEDKDDGKYRAAY